jgi:hypothetical protein
MIDLTHYGFTETKKTPSYTEYERLNDGLRITIFDYPVKTSGGSEIHRQTFVVNTKQATSMPFPLNELEGWLKEKNIIKTS